MAERLAAARRTNGGDRVIINNSSTLDPNRRGFCSAPPGHSFVGGWSPINRAHLLYEDLDGDGVKEVIGEHNGTWNRVTVYPADGGQALYNAQFGPGVRMPARNMRDLDIADLDGDGKKEILAATANGLIVALDHQCQRVWATRLHSPPNVMQAFVPEGAATPWIVVGCDDGTIVVLDGTGAAIRVGQLNGRPGRIAALEPAGAPVAVLATDKGEVKGFRIGG